MEHDGGSGATLALLDGSDTSRRAARYAAQVARRAGVSRRTVDFSSRMGLLEPAARSEGNYRLCPPHSVDQIRLIRRLEEHGVSLAEISASLRRPHRSTRKDVERTLDEVDPEIHALRKAVKSLPAAGGVAPTAALSALSERLRSLIETALEITGGGVPPGM